MTLKERIHEGVDDVADNPFSLPLLAILGVLLVLAAVLAMLWMIR